MLRVTKIRPKKTTTNTYVWSYQFHRSQQEDEIDTIQLQRYEWKDLPLPKKDSLRTTKRLSVWFQKIIHRKFKTQCKPFEYHDSSYHSILTQQETPNHSTCVLSTVMFVVLYDSIHTELQSLSKLPPTLKLELIKQYNS